MTVEHRHEDTKGSFYIAENGMQEAEMAYSMAGTKTMIIAHTEVGEALKGKGAGLKMLLALVDYARQNDINVIPLCPFAKSVFDKREDLRDVVK